MRTQERTTSTARFGASLLGALLALSTFSVPASGGSLDLGFGLGVMDLDKKTLDWGGEDTRIDLRLGYFINDHLELEAQAISITPESMFSDNFQRALMLNGLYYFKTNHKAKPYLLLGVGTVEMEGPGRGWLDWGPDEESFGYQAGIGARYYPSSEVFSIRVDLSALGEDTFGEHSLHLSLTAGVAWRLGG